MYPITAPLKIIEIDLRKTECFIMNLFNFSNSFQFKIIKKIINLFPRIETYLIIFILKNKLNVTYR